MNHNQQHLENRPILSIIIPVFNTEAYVEESIDSVLSQDFSDFEIIAVNDGSEDLSGKILDSYQSKDPRIKVFHRKNSGLSATRNYGLKKADGRFIYFLDSDDRLVPEALGRLVGFMQKSGAEVIGFSGRYINEDGHTVQDKQSYQKPDVTESVAGEDLLVKMMKSGTYSPVISMYIYRKSFLQDNQLSFREGYIHEDEFYTVCVLCMADRALSVSDVYYHHRVRTGSIMAGKPGMKNLKGWTEAASQMLAFVRKYPLKPVTKKVVLNRAGQLVHNSIKIIQRLNREEKKTLSINDYFTQTELGELVFDVRLRIKYPRLYKVYKRLYKVYKRIKTLFFVQ